MNKFRANWLKKVIKYDTNGPQKPYKMAKKWWETLSHKERKKHAHSKDVRDALGNWFVGGEL